MSGAIDVSVHSVDANIFAENFIRGYTHKCANPQPPCARPYIISIEMSMGLTHHCNTMSKLCTQLATAHADLLNTFKGLGVKWVCVGVDKR